MTELIKAYIGKDCLINTMNSQFGGTVKGVSEGWLLVETQSGTEAVNLDYIVRIREYPVNKKGKRKTFVTD